LNNRNSCALFEYTKWHAKEMKNDREKYQTLLSELEHMISTRGKGYKMAEEMKHEF